MGMIQQTQNQRWPMKERRLISNKENEEEELLHATSCGPVANASHCT